MEQELYQEMYAVERQHWWFRARREILVKCLVEHLAGGKVLDVGCGTGFMLEILQSEFGDRYESWGLDMAAMAIAFCQAKGLERIYQGTLADHGASLPTEYFDMLMFLDTIEHINDDFAVLMQGHRYLQDRGHILITVPAYQFLWSGHDVVHGHYRRYTKSQLADLVHRAGYEVRFMSYFNTLLFPPIVIARLINNFRNYFRSHNVKNTQDSHSDAKLPAALVNQLLYQVFQWERQWLPNFSFPFGVSIICLAQRQPHYGTSS
ncbi:MAG: class I SAM-dependent methyltransferase [Pseudanabaenaceae cyanobacterium bins.39]|nr:class I SAM-dependent methyltransferase [Pseudanabaenaceae cyanobacterium bins.39]